MGKFVDIKRGERHWNWKGGLPLCIDCKKPLSRTKPTKKSSATYTGRCKVCAWKLRGSEVWNCGTCGKKLSKGIKYCREHVGEARKLKNINYYCVECGVRKNNCKPGRCRKCDVRRRTALYPQKEGQKLKKSFCSKFRRNMKSGNSAFFEKTVGYTFQELKTHLESRFQDLMTWDNYGFWGWHIDHIVPLDTFDCTKIDEIQRAFALDNLQPLWLFQNVRKSRKRGYVVEPHIKHDWECVTCGKDMNND